MTLADLRVRSAYDVLAGENCSSRFSTSGAGVAAKGVTEDSAAMKGSVSAFVSDALADASPEAATGGVQAPASCLEKDKGVTIDQKGFVFLPSATPSRLKGASGAHGIPQCGANGRSDAREAAPTVRFPSDRFSANPLAGADVERRLVVSPLSLIHI